MKNIRNVKKSRISSLILLSLICFLFLGVGKVIGVETPSVTIPVKQIFIVKEKGGLHKDPSKINDTFYYTLVPVETDAPVPKGRVGEVCPFSLKGSQSLLLDPITYYGEGVYHYELKQVIDKEEKNYTYDKTKYMVTVYVDYNSQGELSAQTIIKNSEGEKVDIPQFENEYDERPQATGDSTESTKKPGGSSTQTGDENKHIWLFILVNAAALIVAGIAIPALQRRNKDKV